MEPAQHTPILMVGNFLSGSRPYRLACEELATQLATRGWEVLVTSSKSNRVARIVEMIQASWQWRHRYRAAQVDVFSGPAFLWAEAACWTLSLASKPYILTLRGGNLPLYAQKWPRRVRRLLRSAFAVTVPSPYLLERMNAFHDNLRVIPNALHLGAYSYRLRTTVRPALVWLRAFHRIYNPQLVPEILASLAPDFPSVQITMVGPDKGDGSFQETQQAAESFHVQDRIRFVQGISKSSVPGVLEPRDIFLNTTAIDNTPVTVLEAMACGLCIVSTNVGGIPYLLETEKDALLVPPNDAHAFARAIVRLLTEPGLAERLSANARQKALRYDWSVVLPQWELLLQAASSATIAA